MCPEASQIARSNLTEEELKYLLRTWNYDLKQKDSSSRSDKEGEWLARLWNFDCNDGGNVELGPSNMKREKWLSQLWNYDLKSWEKIANGQYIVARPPKKPGGRRPKMFPMRFWEILFLPY